MSISRSLRRAAALQEKIEALGKQLAEVLDQARAELETFTLEGIAPTTPRGGGKRAVTAVRRRRSPLAGRKRAASPSGPLAPAVVKVLARHKKPLGVGAILKGLLAAGYAFNAAEPKKNLAARIYRLKGVKQVGTGLFTRA